MSKRKLLALLSSICLFTCVNVASADTFVFHLLPGLNGADACSNIQGTWTGTGTGKIGASVCVYSGSATISGTSNVTVNIHQMTKVSGGWNCLPDVSPGTLTGTCNSTTNTLTVSSKDGSVSGAANANNMNLQGNINVFNMSIPVTIAMKKN